MISEQSCLPDAWQSVPRYCKHMDALLYRRAMRGKQVVAACALFGVTASKPPCALCWP